MQVNNENDKAVSNQNAHKIIKCGPGIDVGHRQEDLPVEENKGMLTGGA
jgi:hypothetical protein